MKKMFLPFALLLSCTLSAQDTTKKKMDDTVYTVTVHKDPRLAILAGKQEPVVNLTNLNATHSAKGYRLMVLSTTDRQQAINVRSSLLQHFPDQKVYMSFQPPYVKLRFGNFLEKSEADKFKLEIKKGGIVTTNVYLVPEVVEIKGTRLKEFLDKDKDN